MQSKMYLVFVCLTLALSLPFIAKNCLRASTARASAQATCQFTLSSTNQSFPASGGAGSVTFTTADSQCPWTARSDSPWITITSATSGVGAGTIRFSVAPTIGSRSGTLTVVGKVFTVLQEYYPCAGAPNFAVPRLFPTVAAPGKFLSADFNGDGLIDLVFLSSFSQSNRLTISLGVAGGSFAAPVTIASGAGFPSPTPAFGAGDFNEDGKLDLIVAGGGTDNRAILLTGDGAGGFTQSATATVPRFTSELRVGDFNNDQHADLVTLSTVDQIIAILIGTGTGSFSAPTELARGGFTPDGLWLADANDDGNLDITGTVLGSLFVFPGNGAGSFNSTIRSRFNSPDGPALLSAYGATFSDLNGDGRKDAVIASDIGVSVLLGNASGFGDPVVHRIGIVAGGPAVADFTGDGRPDIVALKDEGLALLPGLGGGNFGAPVFYYTGLINRPTLIGNFRDAVIGDFNRDGLLDLLTLGRLSTVSNAPHAVALSLGSARGGFDAPLSAPLNIIPNDAVAEDVNGDGLADLIAVGFNGISIFTASGRSEFNAPVNYPAGADPVSPVVRDFNRDGKPDIATLNRGSASVTILLNNGQGAFPLGIQVAIGPFPQSYGVGDFNRDGRLDLIVKNTTGSISLLAGGDGGVFTPLTSNIAAQLNPDIFAAGDFNGDGNLDLAVSAATSTNCANANSEIVILTGNGQGAFAQTERVTIPDAASFLSASDLNSDGRSDLIVKINCGERRNSVVTMLSNQAGGFSQPVNNPVGAEPRVFSFSDLNGDGKPDIITTHEAETISILINNGDGAFASAVSLPTGAPPAAAAIGDVNGDGGADLTVLRNHQFSGSVIALPNLSRCFGAASFAVTSAASFTGVNLAPESIAAGFGAGLSANTQSATTLPLPTSLGGVSVTINDSLGIERLAPLFFVSPNQINYLVPAGVASGVALVTATNGSAVTALGTALIAATSPGLFTANASGQGVAAAVALRVKADGSQVFEPVARFDAAQNRFVSAPIDLSNPAEQVFLILFGTGLRNRSSLANVNVKIGEENVEVLYAGPQGGFAGLDQVNLRLSPNLRGRGEVGVVLAVDGRTANTVRISVS